MKRGLLLLLAGAMAINASAGDVDTLKNHGATVALVAGKHTTAGDWGFYAGHNSNMEQQFGEKYVIDGHGHVLGVVAHITTSTGSVTNAGFEIDFRLWEADSVKGKPKGSSSIEDGHLDLGDANLGGATVVMFHSEAHVDDVFYVTMDLGDYAHDGLAGDTVGLYYATPGTRTTADITDVPYRNVFQAHSHGAPEWKDFYTQFTTPTQIATHLALYPIVELEEHVGVRGVTKNGLQVRGLYPNPANDEVNVQYALKQNADVHLTIMDMSGKLVKEVAIGKKGSGAHEARVNINDLPAGAYVLSVISSEGALGMRLNKL